MHKNIIVMWNFFVHNDELLPVIRQCVQYNRFIVDCICAKRRRCIFTGQIGKNWVKKIEKNS